MSQVPPVRPDLSRRRTLRCGAAALALALSLLGALGVRAQEPAQDAAEAARQEKARKTAQAKRGNHIYTNDDLKRAHILTPEQQARIEARKKNPPAIAPAGQPAQPLDATNSNTSPAESLGDVARRFRREKSARQAEQALKVPPRAGFPMKLSQPSLAAPAPLGVPASTAAPPLKSARPPIAIIAPGRRDPFSRPSRVPALSPPSRTSISALPTPAPMSPAASVPPSHVDVSPRNKPAAIVPQPAAPIDARSAITIRPGDSLWKLARQHLGKGARWPEWLASNPSLADPNRIQPGAKLLVPQIGSASRAQSPPRNISIQKGDSLWKIAHTHLGSGTYWHCLADANPHLQDADHIYPGQSLSIPASCRLAP
jgi:nucleoid-associated protein YgaU